MAVGNQASVAKIDDTLTSLAVSLRELANDIVQQSSYLNRLGIPGLMGIGFSQADAEAVLDNINHMATVMFVYKGMSTQGTAFDFEDYLAPLWGGQ